MKDILPIKQQSPMVYKSAKMPEIRLNGKLEGDIINEKDISIDKDHSMLEQNSLQSEDSIIKEEEETTRTNIYQGSYRTPSNQVANNFTFRREFLDKEIIKVIKQGSSEEITMVRDHVKSKFQKWYNKSLVKEVYYRSKLTELNTALKALVLNDSRRDFQ